MKPSTLPTDWPEAFFISHFDFSGTGGSISRHFHQSEAIILLFFTYLFLLSFARPRLSSGKRYQIFWTCLSLILLVELLTRSPDWVRDLTPLFFLLQGSWTAGLFFEKPMIQLEEYLLSWDRIFHQSGLNFPRILDEILELAYLLAYPMPVLGALNLWLEEGMIPDQFWVVILLAGYLCYGCLPWLQTRPPRILHPQTSRGVLRQFNLWLLHHGGLPINMIPSGHVATAVAQACFIHSRGLCLSPLMSFLAFGITLATVRGKYHYSLDSFLGVGVGFLAWSLASIWSR